MIALAALLCALLAAPQAARAAAGPIEGVVTDATTHEPIEGVVVQAIWRGMGEPPAGSGFPFALTGTDGTYAIGGLGEGEWAISFSTPQGKYLSQYYDGKSTLEDATVLTLGSAALTGIDAELVPGGTIEGAVTAADTGAPIEFASACAWGSQGQLFACAFTNAAGAFALQGLPSDEYRVEFRAEGGGNDFLPEFYADKGTLAEATPVPVTAPATTANVNAALTRVTKPLPPSSTPPPVLSSPPPPLEFIPTAPIRRHHLHCRKGFRKRRVNGKVRCVKVHKKRHHHSVAR